MRIGVTECKALLATARGHELEALIEEFAHDPRTSVRRHVEAARRRRDSDLRERTRLHDLGQLERSLREQGFTAVAGIDEVGRGALAGPVTVAAVILPPDVIIDGIDDSKALDPRVRERVATDVSNVAVSLCVTHVAAHVIDTLGITIAIRRGIERALGELDPAPDHALTDGHAFGLDLTETNVLKGDSKVAAIAAASIVAKVARDQVMKRLELVYPEWELGVNKGYGTPGHLAAIRSRGVTPVHRRSFAPCSRDVTLF